MIFTTKINGIPCLCQVTIYQAPEPETVEYEILDRRGCPAPWLAQRMTQDDDYRLMDEYKAAWFANKYGKDF